MIFGAMKENKDSYQDIIYPLIREVREGDQSAFGKLLQLYEPLFSSLLSKPEVKMLNAQDIEDLRQELTLVFYHSIFSYELEQSEVIFGLYTKICLRNALITQLRKFNKQKTSVSLDMDDEKLSEFLGLEETPSEAIVKRETIEDMNKKINSVLSPFETKVWQMYLTGSSAKSIAVALGKNEKSIENAIFRLRGKLRNLFEN